jgi:hypothetical protein
LIHSRKKGEACGQFRLLEEKAFATVVLNEIFPIYFERGRVRCEDMFATLRYYMQAHIQVIQHPSRKDSKKQLSVNVAGE